MESLSEIKLSDQFLLQLLFGTSRNVSSKWRLCDTRYKSCNNECSDATELE